MNKHHNILQRARHTKKLSSEFGERRSKNDKSSGCPDPGRVDGARITGNGSACGRVRVVFHLRGKCADVSNRNRRQIDDPKI